MVLTKDKRDFFVCSDCAYFNSTEIIDERYPEIKKGYCSCHNKTVDNRWETKCKDNTVYCCCDQCKYFEENFDYDPETDGIESKHICFISQEPKMENDKACEDFKKWEY